MPNLVEVHYEQTGQSKSTNAFGMREMQEKAYEKRDAYYYILELAIENVTKKNYLRVMKRECWEILDNG